MAVFCAKRGPDTAEAKNAEEALSTPYRTIQEYVLGTLAATACHETMCTASSAEKWASLNLEFHRYLTVSQLKTRLFDMVENLSAIARQYVMLSM